MRDLCSSSWIEPSRFFTGFADRRVDINDMTYGRPTTTTTSTLNRDELGAALLFWNHMIAVLTSVFANMQTDVNS